MGFQCVSSERRDCDKCGRSFFSYKTSYLNNEASDPFPNTCYDCIKGHPYDLRELREKVGALYYWIEKNKMSEHHLKTMIQMTEQMLQWKNDE